MEAIMQEMFISVFNMSITASWLVLAIVLIRFAFKKRLKGFCCALWALVGIRLICPFSLESVASLIPSAQVVSPEIMVDEVPMIQTGIGVVDSVVNPVISETLAPSPQESVNPMQVVTFVAAVVWLIGIGGLLLYSLISYLRLQNKVRASMHIQERGYAKENIYLCDNIDSPFILGIIKPRIYLPSDMCEEYQDSVIAHEKAHLARKDHWWKPVGFALLTIHWFNPLMWVAYILLCKDIELACDECVIKEMADEEKKQYSKALLSCSVSHKLVVACPLSFGEVAVKDRIKSVLNYKKPAFWMLVAAVVVGMVVVIGFMTNPIGKNKYGESYIRVSWDEEGEAKFWNLLGKAESKNQYPAIRIDTAEEMTAFIQELDEYFYLTAGEESFEKAVVQYDDAFYDTHSLVVAYIPENSGSIGHKISSLSVEEQVVSIEIEQIVPDVGTDDMAGWFMVHEMEDTKLENRKLVVSRADELVDSRTEMTQRRFVVTDGYTDCEGVTIRLQEVYYSITNDALIPTVVLDIKNTTGEEFVYGREFHVYRNEWGRKYPCAKSPEVWLLDAQVVQGENFEMTRNLWNQNLSKEGHYSLEFEFTMGEDRTRYTACVEFDIELASSTENTMFCGKILEIGDGSILVEPLEGEAIRNSADRIAVGVGFWSEDTWKPEHLKVGTEICVVYDGRIAESYPAQVSATAIYEWQENVTTRGSVDMSGAVQKGYRVFWEEEDAKLFYAQAENSANMEHEGNYYQLPIRKIDTWEEWQEFQSTFDIEQGGEYTAEFFKENSLLMVCISCSSSYEIAVEDLINNGNICCVMLKATLPGEEMTDDIANWIYSFEVKKEWIEYCSYYDSWIQEK